MLVQVIVILSILAHRYNAGNLARDAAIQVTRLSILVPQETAGRVKVAEEQGCPFNNAWLQVCLLHLVIFYNFKLIEDSVTSFPYFSCNFLLNSLLSFSLYRLFCTTAAK